jgi:hypothetical protein
MWHLCERCGQYWPGPLDMDANEAALLAPVCDTCANENRLWTDDPVEATAEPSPPQPVPRPNHLGKEQDKLAHWRSELESFDLAHGADLPTLQQAILFLRRGYYENKIRAFEMRVRAPPRSRKHAGDREMRRALKCYALLVWLESGSDP